MEHFISEIEETLSWKQLSQDNNTLGTTLIVRISCRSSWMSKLGMLV